TYQIKAFLKNYSELEKYNGASLQTINLIFECPSPFFESIEQNGAFLNYVEGGLQFPLVTPTDFGVFGYYTAIDNDGDVSTPIEMIMDGGSKNPVVKNETTGEFIKVEKPLEVFEKLYINTDPENIEVSIIRKDTVTNQEVRENAYGYLTYDSTLFKLKQGLNELTFSSDDEENKKIRIKIYYRKRWIGV
ncbi:MAG: phage tail family protein, partial [Eubacteriales bacterium]|nr:phage tail family protein [Eubacteriales bacterium]